MPLSNYSLDRFVAPKLSELKECNAPELQEKKSWLRNYILNQILCVNINNPHNAYYYNFLRRVDGAFTAYSSGRNALARYIENRTEKQLISEYLESLFYFEVFFSQACQAYLFLTKISGEKNPPKELLPIDFNKLNKFYNFSKHMDGKIQAGHIPEGGTTALWITNAGIECTVHKELQPSEIELLTWDEMKQTLQTLTEVADFVCAIPTELKKRILLQAETTTVEPATAI